MLKNCMLGLVLVAATTSAATAQGILFPSTGAKHRSMGGASTGAALDAAGAVYWNPAAMAGMEDGEVFAGVDFLYANTFLDSAVEATGAFGSNRSDSGLSGAPTFAVVTRPRNSSFTYGLGVYGVVGRTIDFPGSEFNPVLKPYDPPRSAGFGPVSSKTSGLAIAPILSKQLTETIAVGGGAQVTSLSVSLDPAFFASRNPGGLFPPANQGRSYWGGGWQVGVLLTPNERWSYGASYKSRQYFETFEFNSKDERGNARTLSLDLDFPWVLSLGTAYRGFEQTILAIDVRYLGYESAKLFGDLPADGGLGWQSVWALAVGVERTVNDMVKAQGGFSWNGNPIPDEFTIANIQLPAINQFSLSGGASVALTERVDMVGSVVYGLRETNRGTILQIPGTVLELRQDLYTFSLGFAFRL